MLCEILVDPENMASRGRKMLDAMIAAAPSAGVKTVVTRAWQGKAPILMSYGLGHPGRRRALDMHLARGSRLIGWDLGYWNRDEPLRFCMRLTIDADHPQKMIQHEPPERFDAAGIELREDFDPDGPIVLCGLGTKQRRHKALRGQAWELKAFNRIQKEFPGRKIIYRPKKPESTIKGCELATGKIEDSLRGASLLVCSHSNVAVDACIAGIPVQCDDGAAYALYRYGSAPTRAQRLEFLRSLAWWQYSPDQAVQAWEFIKRKIECV